MLKQHVRTIYHVVTVQWYDACFIPLYGKRLYGEESVTMKFHMAMHLPDWIGKLVTCWALERHHKVAKRFLNQLPDTSVSYDTSILREATCHHGEVLKGMKASDFFEVGLVGVSTPTTQLSTILREIFGDCTCQVSHKARCDVFEVVSRGDAIMGHHEGRDFLGKVLQHWEVSLNGETEVCTLLETWTCLESAATYTRWFAGRYTV